MVKSDGPRLSLSDAVSQAARSAGVTPITSSNILQEELETPELQEAYGQQVEFNDTKFWILTSPDTW